MGGDRKIVVVGGGQAGYQFVESLRDGGHHGSITMIADEKCLPYQRPPLSKAFLSGEIDVDDLYFSSLGDFLDKAINVVSGSVRSVNPAARTIQLGDDRIIDFDELVLATGARVRELPGSHGIDGILALRTLADAVLLRDRVKAADHITIIGAGFMGLEAASVLATKGISVRVLELAPRIMMRNISEPVSAVFHRRLAEKGVDIKLGLQKIVVKSQAGKLTGIETDIGEFKTDLVLSCIGVIPNDDLGVSAGVRCANGVLVDRQMQTNLSGISAIGDCARHFNPYFSDVVRLESVQNAIDQAKCLASRVLGCPTDYDAVPWFWSEQADLKLQIAGNTTVKIDGQRMLTGDLDACSFSIFAFRDGQLIGAESVNRPKDHMTARRLLKARRSIGVSELQTMIDLRALPPLHAEAPSS
jgi:3-phenylpropionate/trans-cinnamate dioxygenase ferredoxin reductase component